MLTAADGGLGQLIFVPRAAHHDELCVTGLVLRRGAWLKPRTMEAARLKAVREARSKSSQEYERVADYSRPDCKTRRLLLRSVVVVRAVQATSDRMVGG